MFHILFPPIFSYPLSRFDSECSPVREPHLNLNYIVVCVYSCVYENSVGYSIALVFLLC